MRGLLGLPLFVSMFAGAGVNLLWPGINHITGGFHTFALTIAFAIVTLLIRRHYLRSMGRLPVGTSPPATGCWGPVGTIVLVALVGFLVGWVEATAVAIAVFGISVASGGRRFTSHRIYGVALCLVAIALPFIAGSIIEAGYIALITLGSAGIACCIEEHREFVSGDHVVADA